MSTKWSDGSIDRVGPLYLIICDRISQVFDETIQDVGMVNILEELHQSVLLSKRSKLCHDSRQLPAAMVQLDMSCTGVP